MPIDFKPLWNFSDPVQSEQRFRAALVTASGDDAIVLHAQIARTHGLRAQFAEARRILSGLEPQMVMAGDEARATYWLELGRTFSSSTHPPESQTLETRERARDAYERALEIAKDADSDALAVDALHMLAFVETEPARRLDWAKAALAISQSSSQPAAKDWEASLRNNIGYVLYQLGRYDEALDQFERAVLLRQRGSDLNAARIARWMVAWTLRALDRTDEALAIQLQLERERAIAGNPSAYVFAELAALYRAKGDESRAKHYDELKLGSK